MFFQFCHFHVHHNHKCSHTHLYLTRQYPTITHCTVLLQGENDCADTQWQKLVLAAVASSHSCFRNCLAALLMFNMMIMLDCCHCVLCCDYFHISNLCHLQEIHFRKIILCMYVCMSFSKRFSTLLDTQTPLLPIFPMAFIQVSFIHGLPYTLHPVFLRSSLCSLLFWHPLQCYFG